MIESSLLFIIAIVVYIVILFYFILKRKYNVAQNVVFLIVYTSAVLYLSKTIFPISFLQHGLFFGGSIIPFSNFLRSLKYSSSSPAEMDILKGFINLFIYSIIVMIPLGLGIPLLRSKKSFYGTIIFSLIFVLVANVINIVLCYALSSFKTVFDLGSVMFNIIGICIGYLIFFLAKKQLGYLNYGEDKNNG